MARKRDGKEAERAVTKHLKDLCLSVDWWHHRFPDAGVCLGRIPKQPADYLIKYKGVCALLEVKEEKSLTSISKSRLTQLPKMRIFEMAGGSSSGFLIHHWAAKEPYWVFATVSDLKTVAAQSLNSTQYQKFLTVEEAFSHIQTLLMKERTTCY